MQHGGVRGCIGMFCTHAAEGVTLSTLCEWIFTSNGFVQFQDPPNAWSFVAERFSGRRARTCLVVGRCGGRGVAACLGSVAARSGLQSATRLRGKVRGWRLGWRLVRRLLLLLRLLLCGPAIAPIAVIIPRPVCSLHAAAHPSHPLRAQVHWQIKGQMVPSSGLHLDHSRSRTDQGRVFWLPS